MASYFHAMFHLLEQEVDSYLLQYKRAEEWMEAIYKGANDEKLPLSFFTSGSTGPPKLCSHHKEHLIEEVQSWMDLFDFKSIIWSWVSPSHIYGFLFSILLPDKFKLPVLDGRRLPFSDFSEKSQKGDSIIGFPDLYASWMNSHISLPEGIRAISSTAPLNRSVAADLTAKKVNVVEIYGSSEIGGIGFRQFPEQDFGLLPFWEREGDMVKRKSASPGLALMDVISWTGERNFRVMAEKTWVFR